MAISAARYAGISFAPESRRAPYQSELIQITGATGAAGDTTTYKLVNGGTPLQIVGGAATITAVAADGTATIKALIALGNDAIVVEVLSRL